MRDVLGLDRGGLPDLPPPVAAYIDAYNARDVPRLMATLSEDVEFQNISGGVLTAEATDKAGFEALAIQGASMFASRRQTVLSAITVGRTTHLESGFEGVLAEGGETISLKGASAFDIIDGKITRVVDES
ncbi:MAG: nuclear transport factor 2 family protein [Pseudomonadota bacterium]